MQHVKQGNWGFSVLYVFLSFMLVLWRETFGRAHVYYCIIFAFNWETELVTKSVFQLFWPVKQFAVSHVVMSLSKCPKCFRWVTSISYWKTACRYKTVFLHQRGQSQHSRYGVQRTETGQVENKRNVRTRKLLEIEKPKKCMALHLIHPLFAKASSEMYSVEGWLSKTS